METNPQGLICCRPKGHDGQHIARCEPRGAWVAVWPNKKPTAARLSRAGRAKGAK